MIKVVKLLIIVGLGLTGIEANQMKKYDVKSAKIEYELKGSGDIMGMVKVKSIGKKRLIFDDYGVKNLEERNEVKKETTMGTTKVNKTHTMMYMNDTVMYKVDFDKKIIHRMKNQGAAIAAMLRGGKNIKQTGEEIMIKMGGKKLGTDKVLGFECVIWDLMGTKQCMYKGIPLKVESDIMGMKSTEVAISAVFDIGLNNDDFKLPDYPVYNLDMDVMMQGGEPKELDKSKIGQMDMKDNGSKDIESNEVAQGMAALGAGMAALSKAGIDMSQDISPDQEKMMQKAMMNAMGGEGKMLAMMKKEIFEESSMEEMVFAKECFGTANTLKEANKCVNKGNEMFGGDEELLTSWSKQDKKEMLNDMKEFEKMMPCIQEAQTMDAFQRCMPEDKY
ncbi:MAG: Unknown protein [uncultured Sulfurovum sp.]|uniref:DUF4412 domain-containing protein n=1 Tax=uncultured Sulfurovum sp. TaxID=269237 RepID=A0A6S6U0R2_9BACT|nr:MAG: Unknown protein [uncultured Sulfurovum sp.]